MAYSSAVSPDYYQEFGFKRKESTDQLRQDIERVRRQWRQLAVLSGNKGAEASEKLRLLADAALVFQDDASREAYDQALLSQPVDDSAPIDWIAEARKYYFVDDDDAARAAASKARAVHGNDPQSYVISAWIELREGSRVNGKKEQRNHYKRARDHASNAYILDTREENVADVNYVRGEAFRLLGKHKKAVENFERAYRVQMNTLEQLIIFLPALLIAGHYVPGLWVSALGVAYLVGRMLYGRAYVRDPASRGPGFIIAMVANVLLLLTGLLAILF